MSALTSTCGFLRVVLTAHLAAFRDARTEGDRGASAVELAIITAVIIVIAGVILAAINLFVTNESNKISTTNG